jgi:hypothetical protein
MGLKFQQPEYISVVTDSDLIAWRLPVERRAYSIKDFERHWEYMAIRGEYVQLVFPLACFMAVSFRFKLDRDQQIPRPDATMIKISHYLNVRWEYGDLKTYEDCVMFHGTDFNVIKLRFNDVTSSDDEEDNSNEDGDIYVLQVEAEVGLDTYVTSVLRFCVRKR